ncbi:MAG: hypothetical protein FD138_4253 [Planctomycetota bacterium]|nr:MAG: hypothetical protein FD138_4253 [Planctomycetota bacterium]
MDQHDIHGKDDGLFLRTANKATESGLGCAQGCGSILVIFGLLILVSCLSTYAEPIIGETLSFVLLLIGVVSVIIYGITLIGKK